MPTPCSLLAVELLNRALKRHRTGPTTPELILADRSPTKLETTGPLPTAPVKHLPTTQDENGCFPKPTAEQIMWTHYQHERAHGRTPSGAELDRIAGTHNYGRRIVRKWRKEVACLHTGTAEREPHRPGETPPEGEATTSQNLCSAANTPEQELAESTH